MEQGFVRIEDDGERAEWMPILKAVYEYESKKISGAHGGTRRLSEYAWTLEAMLKHLHKSLPTRALADLLHPPYRFLITSDLTDNCSRWTSKKDNWMSLNLTGE